MKKKNNLFLILAVTLIIVLVIILLLISFNNKNFQNTNIDDISTTTKIIIDKDFSLSFNDAKINQYLIKYYNKGYDIDISYVDNNYILGSFLDTKKNGDMFKTVCLFKYDIKKDEITIYDYALGDRIWDYAILNNNIYYVTISENNNDYSWTLMSSKLDFSNKKTLANGLVLEIDQLPNIINNIGDNNFYIAMQNANYELNTIDTSTASFKSYIRYFKIWDISDSSYKEVYSTTRDFVNNTGYSVCQIDYVQYSDNNLDFCLTDGSKQDFINYSLTTNKESTLYTNTDTDYFITTFYLLNSGIYLNYGSVDDSAIRILKFYNLSTKNEVSLQANYYNTNSHPINDKYILMLTLKNSYGWEIYDTDNNKTYGIVDNSSEEIMPYFFKISDTQILVVNSVSNQLMVGTLTENK